MLIKRIVAFLIDMIVCIILYQFPKYGLIVSISYFIIRDSIILNGRSFGKRLCHLYVKEKGNKSLNVGSSKMILRSLFLLVPILNLMDIYYLFKTEERMVDKWLGLQVVEENK